MSTDDPTTEYNVPLVTGSLIVGIFFGGVGGGVAFPTLPTLGTILGISPFLVGVILSANRFSRLLMNTPAGQIIDTIGTWKPMVAGLFLQALAPFGYVLGLYHESVPLVNATAIFVPARLVWGIGSALVFVGAFSTITHVTTEANRGKWIGYFRGVQSLGFPSGLLVGGVLTDLYGYAVAFLFAGGTGLVAMAVAAAVLPDLRPSVTIPARIRDLPGMVRADRRILMIGTVNFLVRFLFTGILLSTIVLFAEAWDIRIGGFSAIGVSGIVMAVSLLFMSGTTLASGRLSDHASDRLLIVGPALGVFGIGFAVLGAFPTLPALLTGLALIGVGVGGTNPPLLAYLGDISPEADVGKMGGVYNVFGDVGSTLGPLVAFPLGAAIGYRATYLGCVGLVAVVGLLVFWNMRRPATVGDVAPSHE